MSFGRDFKKVWRPLAGILGFLPIWLVQLHSKRTHFLDQGRSIDPEKERGSGSVRRALKGLQNQTPLELPRD